MYVDKDVMKKPEEADKRLHYLEDEALYMLWKYLNGRRFIHKDRLTFKDIACANLSIGQSAELLLESLKTFNLVLEDGIFYKRQCMQDYVPEPEEKELFSNADIKDEVFKNFTIEDYKTKSLTFGSASLFNFFDFSNHISEESRKKLNEFIDYYINEFVSDNLEISTRNFYTFQRQKETWLISLKELEKSYGNQFIIQYRPGHAFDSTITYNAVAANKHNLFIHTLICLEKLGYLTIQEIEVLDIENTREHPTREYKIKLVLSDKFYEEVNPELRKPETVIEKFDKKKGILKFAGQEIELSKNGKETDAVLLMETLLKAELSEWKHNDEILTSWGYITDADQQNVAKNKVYHAGIKINDAVAKKTKIEDLVECSTTKARINPRYRKSL